MTSSIPPFCAKQVKALPDSFVQQPVLSIWIELCCNQTNYGLDPNRAPPYRAWLMDWKSLYLITPAAQSWVGSIWKAVQWNSNMDTLQLLTPSLSGHCAFSVLTLVVHIFLLLALLQYFWWQTLAPFSPLRIIDASQNMDTTLLLLKTQ